MASIIDDSIDDITILIISSPAPSNPELYMIQTVIDSINNFHGLEEAPILIVLDGYVIQSKNRTKKGKVTSLMANNYEQYYINLQEYYKDNQRVSIIKSPSHLGFAMAVKYGLEQCKSTYALVCQHDRRFIKKFYGLRKLIHCMETHEHIRYIGFPTSCNRKYRNLVYSRYPGISIVNDDFITIDSAIGLQPLIFWFDSQHLCHVQRYLQIFKPYTNLPQELRDLFGLKVIRSMVLKKGDFIEDRFGQLQRNLLMAYGNKTYESHDDDNNNNNNNDDISDNDSIESNDNTNNGDAAKKSHIINLLPYNEELLIRIFKWFGTYLLWMPDVDEHAIIMVQHMKGRQRLTSHFQSLSPIEYT